MKIMIKDVDQVSVLSLNGRLDLATGAGLKEEIKKLCDMDKTRIHLNLEQVDFINSSGLGALVSVMKQIRLKKGRLTLSNLAPYVREIFDITQLAHVFDIFDTEQDAVSSKAVVAG